ncbi:hypothetical protein CEE37_00880 [candidate division LCP-89 bacterium B3_LCP]|uniref:DUF1570 domain-containing protein n=1 Tax=candidate division LCP-89 bacterium B3_LCP TaxID=2012998 RepID=A0A532V4X8_UNCL8|nr:MAG: hypothetical protein CEE37_00880 [candidate division LCP-89 bacterium B3_LCP]
MRRNISFIPIIALIIAALCLSTTSLFAEDETFTEHDIKALKACEGVIKLFQQFQDTVWSGYNLAEIPFIFYMPEKWALLLNYDGEVEGFTSYPSDWPSMGTEVLFHSGQYRDLVGQLGFYQKVDTVIVVAVPYVNRSIVDLFAFIVHEAFHEYQFEAFGEIPWAREEKYPIQDSENTAWAYLEMRLLMDALRSMEADDPAKCRQYAQQFAAVRQHRWESGDPFIAQYEQGQEINEGTAKYVELKCISLMTDLHYSSSLKDVATSLLDDFSSISMPDYLLQIFENRLTGNSISPEDVPRNRIYSVGAAQGFLADYFGIDWKSKAQAAGTEFAFVKLMQEEFGWEASESEKLLKQIKADYNFDQSLKETEELIDEYTEGFNEELQTFNRQSGYRIEIEVSRNGLSRSRSSSAKKWLVDQGTQELRSHFNVYVLKNKLLLLDIHDTGILEQNNWEDSMRKVIFFVQEISSLIIDDKHLELSESAQHNFNKMEMSGEKVNLNYSGSGVIMIDDKEISIQLKP